MTCVSHVPSSPSGTYVSVHSETACYRPLTRRRRRRRRDRLAVVQRTVACQPQRFGAETCVTETRTRTGAAPHSDGQTADLSQQPTMVK